MAVVDDDRAVGADHLDPRRREIRITGRQRPAAADDDRDAAIHREHDPLRIGDGLTRRLLHHAEVLLRINAHGLRGLEAPQQEIEVVRRFHRRGRELDAAADLLAEIARDVAAHERAHGPADDAVADLLAHIGELRVEALRIADRELDLLVASERDQLVGFRELERDRFLEEDVLAGGEPVARHGEVRRFRSGGDEDRVDLLDPEKIAIVGHRLVRGGRALHLGEALGPDFGEMQGLHQRICRGGFRANASAPAGADDGHADLLLHEASSMDLLC